MDYIFLQLSLCLHNLFRSLRTLRSSPWLIIFIKFILICLIYKSEYLPKAVWAKRSHVIKRIIIRSLVSILNCKVESWICWLHRNCTHFMLVSQKSFLGLFRVFKDAYSWCSSIIKIRFVNFIEVWVRCGFELTYI